MRVNKKKMKKMVKSLGIAGLVAGATLLSGCVSAPKGDYKCTNPDLTDRYGNPYQYDLHLYGNKSGYAIIEHPWFGEMKVDIQLKDKTTYKKDDIEATCWDWETDIGYAKITAGKACYINGETDRFYIVPDYMLEGKKTKIDLDELAWCEKE